MQGLTLTLQNGFCGSPVSGVEQAEPNQLLLRGFFAAVLRSAEADHGQPPPRVHLTVATSQFSDWGVLAAAHDAFFALERVHKFDAEQHAHYTPRRNDRDDTFEPHGQVLTYAFVMDEARLRSAAQLLVGEPSQHGAFIGDCDAPQFSLGTGGAGQLRRGGRGGRGGRGSLRSEPANPTDPGWGK